ncbi:fumarylacetoacetate hydrolase family protein [uncultured Sphingomonas sp.]|uniref:fumarylacetoacetate hydrolase family protein n=1 Tax=uncultured Sphingomonas sp. TaxID=158754 RepID=UPI002628AB0C|nr:fumarylacetoacetate hydrolase family protein [uncultured Sphingomonas sp.]
MIWHALATWRRDGAERAAIVVGDAIHDLDGAAAAHAPSLVGCSVNDLIADWANAAPVVAALAEALGACAADVSRADLAAPFVPRRVFGAASNYIEHAEEMQTKLAAKADSEPYVFLKTIESVIGPEETVVIPPQVKRPDWEVELGVVIGHAGRDIAAADAFAHIAGYTIVNDVSARDKTRRTDFPFSHDWFRGKSFDTFTPIGPWFVPRDCLGDPHDIRLGLKVNDAAMQDGNTAEMIFDCFEQIAYLSTILELKAGDLIATGTPAGVGMGRGVFLKDGDVMTAWVDGIGELRNPVRAG